MSELQYGPMHDGELGAVARLVHHAFAGPVAGCEEWLRNAGVQNVRVMRDGATVLANLVRIPMGQYFGGRSVGMLGIAGVAVAPEARGRGLARRMMGLAMQEAQADGFALSGLYASTVALYRQVGFEQAGHRFITRLPIHRIDVRERSGAVRPLAPEDEPAIRACYARFASRFDGPLDRGEYVWQRTRKMREDSYKGFGIEGRDGGLSGYLFLNQQRKVETGRFDLAVSDLVFDDASAARRLLGFLSDFATIGDDVVFAGGPLHPLLSVLNEIHYKVEKKDYWMIRVLDVARAIESRGFGSAAGLAELTIHDERVSSNSGSWRVSLRDGAGAAERLQSSSHGCQLDIRALAPLYSGLYSPAQAALLGWVQGSEAALRSAGGIFPGGGGPWMSDMF